MNYKSSFLPPGAAKHTVSVSAEGVGVGEWDERIAETVATRVTRTESTLKFIAFLGLLLEPWPDKLAFYTKEQTVERPPLHSDLV
jgi:hypothetical protein